MLSQLHSADLISKGTIFELTDMRMQISDYLASAHVRTSSSLAHRVRVALLSWPASLTRKVDHGTQASPQEHQLPILPVMRQCCRTDFLTFQESSQGSVFFSLRFARPIGALNNSLSND